MFRFLQVWKEYVKYEKHTADRLKLRLINLHKQSLSKALFKWKESCDKKQMVDLANMT